MFKKLFSSLFGSKKKNDNNTGDDWVPKHNKTPEELCEIDPNTMSPEAIRKHLAMLYKRHNDAISSMKPELRAEAKYMLDAIVVCRQRYVDSSEAEAELA